MIKKFKGVISSISGSNNDVYMEITIMKSDYFDLTEIVGKEVEIIIKWQKN